MPEELTKLAGLFDIPVDEWTGIPQFARRLDEIGRPQRALWTLRKYGFREEADEMELELAREIRRGGHDILESHVLDGTTRPKLVTLRRNVVGVFKPGRDGKHEIAAYELDKLFGLNRVPMAIPIVLRDPEGNEVKRGSFQLFISNSETLDARFKSRQGTPTRPIGDILFFDIIVNNIDRVFMQQDDYGNRSVFFNYKNVLLAQPDDYQVAIDFANGFDLGNRSVHDSIDFRSTTWDRWFLPTKHFLDRIESVSRDEIRAKLSPFLSGDEIQVVFDNMDWAIPLARMAIKTAPE